MVVELILSTLVTQAVGHYAQKGFDWLDARTEDLAEQASHGDEEARVEVAVRLQDTLRALPVSVGDAGPTPPAASPSREQMVADIVFSPPPRDPVEATSLTPRLAKFAETLDGAFRAVHELPGQVAAVPGWFHSELCVAVLDARARQGRWEPDARLVHARYAGERAYLQLDDVDAGRVGSFDLPSARGPVGRPRVVVVDCDDAETQASALGLLRPVLASLDSEGRHWSKLALAAELAVDPSRVRSVLGVYDDRVLLGAPASDLRGDGESFEDHHARTKLGELTLPLSSTAGVKAFKADLVRQVLDAVDLENEWLDI